MTPWIIKYTPKAQENIFGREKELAILQDFIRNHSSQKKKALLLFGPSGSGKTTAIQAIGKELNYEVFEVNASDSRNKASLNEIVLPAVKQKSFFSDGKIVLLDEVDGLSGSKDRGGALELSKIIDQSSVPIILTANIMDVVKLKPILKKAQTLMFDKLSTQATVTALKHILAAEKKELDDTIIRTIAVHADGDVRAAINDLQTIVENPSAIDLLTDRRRTKTMQEALRIIFKSTSIEDAIAANDTVLEDFDKQFLWMDYNLPHEYTRSVDLARAYGALTKADVFRARIRKQQEWRFLVYVNFLLTAGISIAKDEVYKNRVEYKESTRLLKQWQVNMQIAKRKLIAAKIAEKTHCSISKAFKEVPYYNMLIKQNPAVAKELDLEKDEIAFLTA